MQVKTTPVLQVQIKFTGTKAKQPAAIGGGKDWAHKFSLFLWELPDGLAQGRYLYY